MGEGLELLSFKAVAVHVKGIQIEDTFKMYIVNVSQNKVQLTS